MILPLFTEGGSSFFCLQNIGQPCIFLLKYHCVSHKIDVYDQSLKVSECQMLLCWRVGRSSLASACVYFRGLIDKEG